ncbi:MAG TPA: exodeoxyribonuclease VII small subunit [Polyangiaceae bacterium]|jgi:exodeoxyribonuclease VII small subunit
MSSRKAQVELSLEEADKAGESAAPSESFEASLERLSHIVEELESGELSLEQALTLFEDGIRLARLSQARLDQAEKRVEELLAVDDAGNPVTRELDVD